MGKDSNTEVVQHVQGQKLCKDSAWLARWSLDGIECRTTSLSRTMRSKTVWVACLHLDATGRVCGYSVQSEAWSSTTIRCVSSAADFKPIRDTSQRSLQKVSSRTMGVHIFQKGTNSVNLGIGGWNPNNYQNARSIVHRLRKF